MLSLAQIIFFILAIVINLLLGLIVIRQASNKNANQLFLAFILSVLTWLIFNFLTDVYTSNSLLFSRLTYFGSTRGLYLISGRTPCSAAQRVAAVREETPILR